MDGTLVGAAEIEAASRQSQVAQLKLFLDCTAECYPDFLRSEVTFVDYVRDRTEAEVHLLVTSAQTASGGSEYTLTFVGVGRFQGVTETLTTVTESSDTDDIIRRQLATSVRAGLLRYLTTSFRVAGGRVELRRGLVSRHVLSTPVERVRTVDLTSSLIHRALGLTTLRVGTGTASTSDDEKLDLDGLPVARARALRAELGRAGVVGR